jgi:hypothetical protein
LGIVREKQDCHKEKNIPSTERRFKESERKEQLKARTNKQIKGIKKSIVPLMKSSTSSSSA